jgi:hypothetical protein
MRDKRAQTQMDGRQMCRFIHVSTVSQPENTIRTYRPQHGNLMAATLQCPTSVLEAMIWGLGMPPPEYTCTRQCRQSKKNNSWQEQAMYNSVQQASRKFEESNCYWLSRPALLHSTLAHETITRRRSPQCRNRLSLRSQCEPDNIDRVFLPTNQHLQVAVL